MALALLLFVRISQSRAEESLERTKPVARCFFAPRQPEGKREGRQQVTLPSLITTDNERLVKPSKGSMTWKWKQDSFVAISSMLSVTGYPLQYGLNVHHSTTMMKWQSIFRDTNSSQVDDYCSPQRDHVARFHCYHIRGGPRTLDWQGTINSWWNLGRGDIMRKCAKIENVGQKLTSAY